MHSFRHGSHFSGELNDLFPILLNHIFPLRFESDDKLIGRLIGISLNPV